LEVLDVSAIKQGYQSEQAINATMNNSSPSEVMRPVNEYFINVHKLSF